MSFGMMTKQAPGAACPGAHQGETGGDTSDAAALFRWRLASRAAAECAARGFRRLALYGAGRHTRAFIRQPWAWHHLRVTAVLDDEPGDRRLGGFAVMRPEELQEPVDAVVVSSESFERQIAARAEAVFGPRGIPVLRIYGDEPAWEDNDRAIARLVRRADMSEAEAKWLVANRRERHDATLPMLPPERTELHLRRYELAGTLAAGKRVLDAACGTGYGSAFLMDQGRAASIVGLDLDAATIAYASGRHARQGVDFRCAGAESTGLAGASVDLAVSFETIEHVPDPGALLQEFARVLAPGGRLVMSTPNDRGLSEFHAHSFTPDVFGPLIEKRFRPLRWLGQRAADAPAFDDLPPGMFPLDDPRWTPETILVVAEPR